MYKWVLNTALNCVCWNKVVFNPLQILFFETFIGYKTIALLYTSWSEADLKCSLPFVSAESFHHYWKLLFNTFNRLKQTQNN